MLSIPVSVPKLIVSFPSRVRRYQFLSSPHQWVTHADEKEQVLVFERGPLVFVFNWSPNEDYAGYKVGDGLVYFGCVQSSVCTIEWLVLMKC